MKQQVVLLRFGMTKRRVATPWNLVLIETDTFQT